MLALKFIDIEPDRAKRLVNALRDDLIKRGIDPDRLTSPPGDKNNMSVVADILNIVLQEPLHAATVTMELAIIAHSLRELLGREVVEVFLEGGKVTVKHSDGVEVVQKKLEDAAQVDLDASG
jgi:hypothetical protein